MKRQSITTSAGITWRSEHGGGILLCLLATSATTTEGLKRLENNQLKNFGGEQDITMKSRKEEMHKDFEEVFDRGIIVIVDGMAWGPFEMPEQALGWALKYRPDNLFKLMHLISPDIIDAIQ